MINWSTVARYRYATASFCFIVNLQTRLSYERSANLSRERYSYLMFIKRQAVWPRIVPRIRNVLKKHIWHNPTFLGEIHKHTEKVNLQRMQCLSCSKHDKNFIAITSIKKKQKLHFYFLTSKRLIYLLGGIQNPHYIIDTNVYYKKYTCCYRTDNYHVKRLY